MFGALPEHFLLSDACRHERIKFNRVSLDIVAHDQRLLDVIGGMGAERDTGKQAMQDRRTAMARVSLYYSSKCF